MSHVRQQIREAAAIVLTGLAISGSRVFQNRLRPLKDADLPCLLINTDDEDIETIGFTADAPQERRLTLMIRALAKQSLTLDDTLDNMLAEIESALARQTFGGLAKSLLLEKISIEMNDDLEKPVGVASAHYQLTYYTATGNPGTAL